MMTPYLVRDVSREEEEEEEEEERGWREQELEVAVVCRWLDRHMQVCLNQGCYRN